MNITIKNYDHAPTHWFIDNSIYFFTASVYQKAPLLKTSRAKTIFLEKFFHYISEYHWQLYEWVVLDNHYHFLAKVPYGEQIPRFFNTLHQTSAFHVKKECNFEVKPFWY
ncbi:MAG: transposase [Deferribacteres bacterium]|nr:transposase [Deferribacteres bacterium]